MVKCKIINFRKLHDGILIIFFLFRFAGNKCTIRQVASRFNMGESTFHNKITVLLKFFVSIAPFIIRFPERYEEKVDIAKEFEKVNKRMCYP